MATSTWHKKTRETMAGWSKKTPPVLAPKLYGESGDDFFDPPECEWQSSVLKPMTRGGKRLLKAMAETFANPALNAPPKGFGHVSYSPRDQPTT